MTKKCTNCAGAGTVRRPGRPPDYVTCPGCGGRKTVALQVGRKKKPMVTTERAWGMVSGSPNELIFTRKRNSLSTVRCVITDARRPTALKAVEKVLQRFFDTALLWDCPKEFQYTRMRNLGRAAGVTTEVTNGRVKCQWRDK